MSGEREAASTALPCSLLHLMKALWLDTGATGTPVPLANVVRRHGERVPELASPQKLAMHTQHALGQADAPPPGSQGAHVLDRPALLLCARRTPAAALDMIWPGRPFMPLAAHPIQVRLVVDVAARAARASARLREMLHLCQRQSLAPKRAHMRNHTMVIAAQRWLAPRTKKTASNDAAG